MKNKRRVSSFRGIDYLLETLYNLTLQAEDKKP